MKITLLGTGTSTGVPVIGCNCKVCKSADIRDKRTRCSCYIETNGLHLLIDTGPDFRQQALREGLRKVDAVFYSHFHFDHVTGLDDLRPFCFRNDLPVPCFAKPDTAAVLRSMYPYIFVKPDYPGIPNLTLLELPNTNPVTVSGRYGQTETVDICPVPLFHGDLEIFGYRIGNFAYLTDTSRIPASSFSQLQDLDVLVLDALREKPHPTHFTFAEAVLAAQSIGARQTYLIHMTHGTLHAEIMSRLPDGIAPGYDGLQFSSG